MHCHSNIHLTDGKAKTPWEYKRRMQGDEQSPASRTPNPNFRFVSILPFREIKLGKENKRRWKTVVFKVLMINTIFHFLKARSPHCILSVLKPSMSSLCLLPSSNLEGIYLISYSSSHKPKLQQNKTAWKFAHITYIFIPLCLCLQFLLHTSLTPFQYLL